MKLTAWRKRHKTPSNKHLIKKAMEYSTAKYWYSESRAALKSYLEVELNNRIELSRAIKILAATSPRNDVKMNLKFALQEIHNYIHGRPIGRDLGIAAPHIYINLVNIRQNSPLTGIKTLTFEKALSGDENAIVLDTWIGELFHSTKIQQAEERYIPVIIRKIATATGMTPAQTQACLWVYTKTELNTTSHRALDNFSAYFKQQIPF